MPRQEIFTVFQCLFGPLPSPLLCLYINKITLRKNICSCKGSEGPTTHFVYANLNCANCPNIICCIILCLKNIYNCPWPLLGRTVLGVFWKTVFQVINLRLAWIKISHFFRRLSLDFSSTYPSSQAYELYINIIPFYSWRN